MLAILQQRDWSERLNPILIKELRQAVRSPYYVAVFVIVQLLMILYVAFALSTVSSASDMRDADSLFWTILGAYLLCFIPITGFNALIPERRDGRLDLLRLATINPRSIVVGKWLSINVQAWLVVLSLAPYITLRYFVGSINPLEDLMKLAFFVYYCLVGTGMTVASSSAHSVWRVIAFFIFSCIGMLLSCLLIAPFGMISSYMLIFVSLLHAGFIWMLMDIARSHLEENEPIPFVPDYVREYP